MICVTFNVIHFWSKAYISANLNNDNKCELYSTELQTYIRSCLA